MSKILSRPQFKVYNQQQGCLLPLNLEELIASSHLVRVVNSIVDQMDIRPIISTYKGGGTTSFCHCGSSPGAADAWCYDPHSGVNLRSF